MKCSDKKCIGELGETVWIPFEQAPLRICKVCGRIHTEKGKAVHYRGTKKIAYERDL